MYFKFEWVLNGPSLEMTCSEFVRLSLELAEWNCLCIDSFQTDLLQRLALLGQVRFLVGFRKDYVPNLLKIYPYCAILECRITFLVHFQK